MLSVKRQEEYDQVGFWLRCLAPGGGFGAEVETASPLRENGIVGTERWDHGDVPAEEVQGGWCHTAGHGQDSHENMRQVWRIS